MASIVARQAFKTAAKSQLKQFARDAASDVASASMSELGDRVSKIPRRKVSTSESKENAKQALKANTMGYSAMSMASTIRWVILTTAVVVVCALFVGGAGDALAKKIGVSFGLTTKCLLIHGVAMFMADYLLTKLLGI